MNPMLFIPIVVALLAGFGVGCVPILNEHLHWNVWFVIPISGALFGLGAAWLEFLFCRLLRIRITPATQAILIGAAVLSYFATEYGTYVSTSVTISAANGRGEQIVRIADLIPFLQYLGLRLGSSALGGDAHRAMLELGGVGTTLHFVADLIGAALGAGGMLIGLARAMPYPGLFTSPHCGLVCSPMPSSETRVPSSAGLQTRIVGAARSLLDLDEHPVASRRGS